MDILERIEEFENEEDESEMFEMMLNLLIDLDPDILNDSQIEKLEKLLDDIEVLGIDDVDEARRAKKSLATIKQYARAYYRKKKLQLKKAKKRIMLSAEGKKRKKNKKRMASQKKSPGGRKQIIYNTKGHVNK